MSFYPAARSFDDTADHLLYLRRRVREEVDAAASANSHAATLIHVALASAYAEQSLSAGDRAWIADNRVW